MGIENKFLVFTLKKPQACYEKKERKKIKAENFKSDPHM